MRANFELLRNCGPQTHMCYQVNHLGGNAREGSYASSQLLFVALEAVPQAVRASNRTDIKTSRANKRAAMR